MCEKKNHIKSNQTMNK